MFKERVIRSSSGSAPIRLFTDENRENLKAIKKADNVGTTKKQLSAQFSTFEELIAIV